MAAETLTQLPESEEHGLNGLASRLPFPEAPEEKGFSGRALSFPSSPQVAVDPPNKVDPAHPLSSETHDVSKRFRKLDLMDRYIDEPRKLRVAVIGAGISGVIAGVLLPVKVPGIELTIYDKNEEVVGYSRGPSPHDRMRLTHRVKGGTWFENVYPGVRCDIPAHVYQTSFDPNPQWSEEFAQGKEIKEYWQGLARKHGVYDYLKLSHKVEGLEWKADDGVWEIDISDLKEGKRFKTSFDFVLTAIGRFNAWKLPEYPGIDEFQGVLRHAQHWDPEFDPTGKRVAVIGNGASGIQLVSNIQGRVGRLDHYVRNPTWVAKSFAGDETAITPKLFPEELKASFRDPATYTAWRKSVEDKYWRGFNTWLRGSEKNAADRQAIEANMRARLVAKPELLETMIPSFSPHCRRLTPGPGYLEAITAANVDYVQTPIRRFTRTGIETTDGKHREVDAVFCATGANRDMVPPFPIRGRGGTGLASVWAPGGDPGFPYTYLGAATPGFPNLLYVLGPNANGRSGSVPHSVESQVAFYAKVLRKAAREGIRAMAPSTRAADDFVEYCDAFFRSTVLSEHCSSWYNGGRPGGFVHGLWPGSGAHVDLVHREPRWEDWEYEYLDEGVAGSSGGNRFMWFLGRGATRKEQDPDADMTPYIQNPADCDLRNLHELWWSYP